jgi:hypothetical protein
VNLLSALFPRREERRQGFRLDVPSSAELPALHDPLAEAIQVVRDNAREACSVLDVEVALTVEGDFGDEGMSEARSLCGARRDCDLPDMVQDGRRLWGAMCTARTFGAERWRDRFVKEQLSESPQPLQGGGSMDPSVDRSCRHDGDCDTLAAAASLRVALTPYTDTRDRRINL